MFKWAVFPALSVMWLIAGCGVMESKVVGSQKYVPGDDEILLIVGQDLGSLREYTQSNCCPEPAGVTTYIGLFKLFEEQSDYGGIGIDPQGKPLDYYADWGGGISSLYSLMQEYPNSAIAIGLAITENEHPGAIKKLIDGQYDAEIQHLANLLKQHKHVVYLRIGYEFDGMWNKGYDDADQYIKAYKRIVDVMRKEQVANVSYVWQSSTSPADDSIEGKLEDIRDWYPGDDYVDWMGLSWFIVPDYVGSQSHYASTQNALADELVEFARARKKPVMVAESTPLAYDLKAGVKYHHSGVWDGKPKTGGVKKTSEQIWDEWFVSYFDYIYNNSDVIKAVAYINADWDSQSMWSGDYESGYWGDTRIQENAVIQAKWLEEITKDIWISNPENIQARLNY